MPELPQVGGDVLPCSLGEFEHRCRVWLEVEQRKILPDTALISLICDAVRLGREHVTTMRNYGLVSDTFASGTDWRGNE